MTEDPEDDSQDLTTIIHAAREIIDGVRDIYGRIPAVLLNEVGLTREELRAAYAQLTEQYNNLVMAGQEALDEQGIAAATRAQEALVKIDTIVDRVPATIAEGAGLDAPWWVREVARELSKHTGVPVPAVNDPDFDPDSDLSDEATP